VNDLNLTLGVNINVSTAWKVTLYANYAKESGKSVCGRPGRPTALAAALADTDPATAFNPFGDGSHTNPITLKTLATGGRFYTDSRLRTADVTADGPIGHLPGGRSNWHSAGPSQPGLRHGFTRLACQPRKPRPP